MANVMIVDDTIAINGCSPTCVSMVVAGLTGIKNGNFTVNDPNSPVRNRLLWSYDRIVSQTKNLWEFERVCN